MPAKRLSMRKIREVLRLRSTTHLSQRQIARSVGIASSTVIDYLARLRAAELHWPLADDLSDAEIERLLFVAAPQKQKERPLPEWSQVDQELRRSGVTLLLLWQEYKSQYPDGINYSRFCGRYNLWRGQLDLVMRQHHKAGERLFVDYAGPTMPVADPATGEIRTAQIFVGVLGASNYTYAEATWTQDLADWIGSHQRAFAFLGGVPEIVVPDNLKSGVTHPHRYDPEINRSYAEMAEHYGVAILPARVRKPRDKAKVEGGVRIVEQSILAPLRDRTFFSLQELNQAIIVLLEELNNRDFQKLPGSRRGVFEEIDRPALGRLPEEPYSLAEWKKVRVNIDYHIEVDGHYYSVPFTYARQQLTVRLTDSSLECFVGSQRIAAHLRSRQRGHHTTINEHMPLPHQQYAAATPERITTQAAQTGPATASLVRAVIDQRAHPEQGYRACLGILRLGTAYGSDRLEAACQRALSIGATNYKSIESILKTGLDRQPLPQNPPREPDWPCTAIEHANIRGSAYYQMAPEDSLRTDSPSTAIVLWSAHEQTHDGVMQQGGSNPC